MAKKNPHPGVKALKSVLMECAIDLKANPTLAPVLEVASEELGLKYLIARAKEFLADPTEHNIRMAIALLAVNLHATRPDVKVEKAEAQPVAFAVNAGGIPGVMLNESVLRVDVPNTPEIGSPDVEISSLLVGHASGSRPDEVCPWCESGFLRLQADTAEKSQTGFMLKCDSCNAGDSCMLLPTATEMQDAAVADLELRMGPAFEQHGTEGGPPHPDYASPKLRSFLRGPGGF